MRSRAKGASSPIRRPDERGPRAFWLSPTRRGRWRFCFQSCGVLSALLLAWATPSFAGERERADTTSSEPNHTSASDHEIAGARTIETAVTSKKGDRLERPIQQEAESSALVGESPASRDRALGWLLLLFGFSERRH
jgi:hypothetical protein